MVFSVIFQPKIILCCSQFLHFVMIFKAKALGNTIRHSTPAPPKREHKNRSLQYAPEDDVDYGDVVFFRLPLFPLVDSCFCLGVLPALEEEFPKLQQENWKARASPETLDGPELSQKAFVWEMEYKYKYWMKRVPLFALYKLKNESSQKDANNATPSSVFMESSRHARNHFEWLYVTVWGTMGSAHACYSNHLHCAHPNHPNLKPTHSTFDDADYCWLGWWGRWMMVVWFLYCDIISRGLLDFV